MKVLIQLLLVKVSTIACKKKKKIVETIVRIKHKNIIEDPTKYSILATKINKLDMEKKKKKMIKWVKHDFYTIIYYNYNKKTYYLNICLNPPKN